MFLSLLLRFNLSGDGGPHEGQSAETVGARQLDDAVEQPGHPMDSFLNLGGFLSEACPDTLGNLALGESITHGTSPSDRCG